jgi:ubiquinone/menaquinone biosynthesis C-methylase UbiE
MMQVAFEKVNEYKNFGGFFQCDASNLIFPDRSLDCVVSVRFMGHIPEEVRRRILREIHRVSRYAIIEYSIHSLFVTLRWRFERSIGHKALLPQRWGWHRFERSELINELSEAKLQIVKMWPKLPFLSDSWYVLVTRQSG